MTYSKIQKKALEFLLKKYESSKTYLGKNEVSQSFSLSPEKIFPDYENDFADVDKIRDFENDIARLESESLIAISKNNDRIQKITAISSNENWQKIRTILGVKDKNEQKKEEIGFYSAIYEDSNSCQIVKDFCKQQIERLEAGKKAEYAQNEVKNIIALLNYILNNKTEILERELSIAVLSNSKTWEEKYKRKVLKILRQSGHFDALLEQCDDEKEKNKILLEECNIFSNPSYVHFKGNGKITFENGKRLAVFSDISIALSSSSIRKIASFEIDDSKIMTVENLTSFNRINDSNLFFI